MLDRKKLAQLEQAYRAGYSKGFAAMACDVSSGSVTKYFNYFRNQGIPRKPIVRKPPKPRGVPVYTGPDWIGLSA